MGLKFSVLVPVYNVEKYVGECIESVLGQSDNNFELILVDDGSTDRSGILCDEYAAKDSRIKVFHKENAGQLHTRQYGIDRASGDVFVFLDSDDSLKPDALEKIGDTMEKYGCDCVVYGLERFSGDRILYSNVDKKEECLQSKRDIYFRCFTGSAYNPICRKAVKRDVFDGRDYSGYYGVSISEDLLQSIEIYQNSNSIVFLDAALYNYRLNESSVTQTLKYDNYMVINPVRQVVMEFLLSEGVFSDADMTDYRGYCVFLLCSELMRIGGFDTNTDNKKTLFRTIAESDYYKKYLKDKAASENYYAKYRTVYRLFVREQYGLLLYFLGMRRAVSSAKQLVKRVLSTFLGK